MLVFFGCENACSIAAIYVPEVGPMGDEWCITVEQAEATGVHWEWSDYLGGFICPSCATMRRADGEAV